MKRKIGLVATGLLVAVTALADGYPRQEVYLGYDFLRANSARGIPAFSANGAGGSYAYNFYSWLGAVADINAVHNGNVFGSVTNPLDGITYPGGKIDNTTLFYQFGPRVYYRHWSKVTIFGEMLLGRSTTSVSIPIALPPGSTIYTSVPGGILVICPSCDGAKPSAIHARATTGQSSFAYKLGGGLDWNLSRRLSFRPIQADLQFTRLSQLTLPFTTRSQYNFAYSTGFNFRFGGPQ